MWLILAASLIEAPQQVAMPAWMAGCWEHKSGESWTEECWTGARAGQMMGSSRSGKGEALQWYEHTRITAEGGATEAAHPADDDDHERIDDGRRCHAVRGRYKGGRKNAAERVQGEAPWYFEEPTMARRGRSRRQRSTPSRY